MKRIIDGKSYNTETATSVATWSNTYGRGDPYYIREQLYQTASGAFFLIGEGGSATRYAVPAGANERRASEALLPLSSDEAQRWLEDRDEPEALELLFGKQPEAASSDSSAVLLRLPPALHARIREASAEASMSTNRWLLAAIERVLNAEGKK